MKDFSDLFGGIFQGFYSDTKEKAFSDYQKGYITQEELFKRYALIDRRNRNA